MFDRQIQIEPDIHLAHTLPSWVYTSADALEIQRDRVFARSWQLIGDVNDVRTPGQVYPVTLLPGCLDEPILLTRDANDQLHCMSNVCTHRGNLVVEHSGKCSQLRCAYHGRSFGLDGTFVSMPEFDEVSGFPSPDDNLPSIACEQWGPYIFAALDPAVTFEKWIEAMQQRIGWLPLEQFRFDPSRSRDYLVQANWALYCDNYLEGFHIPFVHASLNKVLDYGQYRTELFNHSNLQLGIAAGGDQIFDLPPESPDHGLEIAGYYFWLFPNLMFNFYPWGLSINIVKPLAADRTKVSYLTYVWDESKLEQGAGAGLDRVEREDETVVESVQRGVASRNYDRGRYSPSREQGVHHFHRLLANFMNK